MDNFEQRLQASSEIHCFNCDVDEVLSRIQEINAAFPDDLGHERKALIRGHEGFETELVTLETQLQVG
jgi:spectrin beta